MSITFMNELDRVTIRFDNAQVMLALQLMNATEPFFNLWDNAIGEVARNELVYENPDLDGKRKIVRPVTTFIARQATLLATLRTYMNNERVSDATVDDTVADLVTALNSFRSDKVAGGKFVGNIGFTWSGAATTNNYITGVPWLWQEKETDRQWPELVGAYLASDDSPDLRIYNDLDDWSNQETGVSAASVSSAHGINSENPHTLPNTAAAQNVYPVFDRSIALLLSIVRWMNSTDPIPSFGTMSSLPLIDSFAAHVYVIIRYLREQVNLYAEFDYKYVDDEFYLQLAGKYSIMNKG
jgi:hypothetical protein